MKIELNADKIIDEALEKAKELMQNQPLSAEIILKQLLKCRPNHPIGLQILGLVEHNLGKQVEAIEIIQVAIEVDPECAENHNNIGLAYASLSQHQKALEHLEQAVKMRPDQYLFYNNLALQYKQLGDYNKSIETFRVALKMQNLPQIWNNLGGIYGELHDLDNAELCFKTALEIDPDFSASHVDLAFCHHLRGNWEKGFEEYEWRFKFFPQLQFYINAYDQEKKWDGIQSLNGKTILLYGEQGLGDTIHFIRYVPKLKELGAKTIVHCPESLDSIIARCDGVDDTINFDIVTNQNYKFPEYDYQCSLISLPHLLKCVDANKIYIEPKVIFNSKEQYPDTFNIGIAWAGSPAHPNDATRSLKLKYFKPIHDIPGVKLFNLQFDMRQRMYRNGITNVDLTEGCNDLKIVDMSNMIQTFEDSATIISGLDLIISCDTALVHLAGAMNVPCWALIPRSPDWRWGIEGSTAYWYDSVKLFRQNKRGDWISVIEEVKGKLYEVILQNK